MKIGKRWAVAMFLLAVTPMHLFAAEKKAPAPVATPAPAPVAAPAAAPVAAPATVPVAAPAALPDTGYRIGPGDVLNIEVWKDPVLTRLVTVLPDGRIAYPLVGEIAAADKTLFQLKKEIEGKLARYLQDAVITVEVRQMNSLQIYVLGRVNAPGRTILNTNVNVLQALAIAGGPNAFANRSRIRIFREEGGKTVSLSFDYDDVTAGKNTESNILLRRGDVIFVP
jgi:polysaccharide biosynthesis/export protein